MECSEGFAELYSIPDKFPTTLEFSNRADTTTENLKISRIVMKIGPTGLIGILVHSKSARAKYKIWSYESGDSSLSQPAIIHTSSLVKAFNILIQNNSYDLSLHLPRLLLEAHKKVKTDESAFLPHNGVLKKELNSYMKIKNMSNYNSSDNNHSNDNIIDNNDDNDNISIEGKSNYHNNLNRSILKDGTNAKSTNSAENMYVQTEIEIIENLIFKKGKKSSTGTLLPNFGVSPDKPLGADDFSKNSNSLLSSINISDTGLFSKFIPNPDDNESHHHRRNSPLVVNRSVHNYDANNNNSNNNDNSNNNNSNNNKEEKKKNDDCLPPINVKKLIEIKMDKIIKKSTKIDLKTNADSTKKILQKNSFDKTPNVISYTVRKSRKSTFS